MTSLHTSPLHILNLLYERIAPELSPNSCDVVVIAGRLQRARLLASIEEVLARHPVLSSRRRRLRGRDVYEVPRPPLAVDVRFESMATDVPDPVDAHLTENIWSEPLPTNGRPVRFHVLETPERTYLQTIHTHVFADATACYLLTEEIAATYGRRAGNGERRPGSRPAQPKHAAPEPVQFRSTAFPSPRKWLRATPHHLADLRTSAQGLRAPRTTPGDRGFVRAVFNEVDTAQLRAAARARGTTMHGLFQLAFVRASAEYNRARGGSPGRLRWWDFFSMRRVHPDLSDRYDCLALIYPVEMDPAWSDDEVLAAARHGAAAIRADAGEAQLTRLSQLATLLRGVPPQLRQALWSRIFKSNVFFTNPGVCPSSLPSFGNHRVVDYVTFPQLFAPAQLMFVFSTFRDRLRVLLTFDGAAFDRADAKAILSGFLRQLARQSPNATASASPELGFVARWNDGDAPADEYAVAAS